MLSLARSWLVDPLATELGHLPTIFAHKNQVSRHP
jgi:hypothetical protein